MHDDDETQWNMNRKLLSSNLGGGQKFDFGKKVIALHIILARAQSDVHGHVVHYFLIALIHSAFDIYIHSHTNAEKKISRTRYG